MRLHCCARPARYPRRLQRARAAVEMQGSEVQARRSARFDLPRGEDAATPAAAPKEKPVIEAGLTLPELPDEVTCHFLKYLNPTKLAKMREVSTLYNNTIKGTHSLNKIVQHGKYLILAKQTAERIHYDDWKSKAYCAIATEEAKSNLETAKQTAERIQYDDQKSLAYCAIAAALLPQ